MRQKPEPRGPDKPATRQHQLSLTYSVGDWVWAKSAGHNARRILARVESASPIAGTGYGDVWLVRCYYSANKRIARPGSGWSAVSEHRPIVSSLNASEVANLRNAGVIPPAGSQVLP
jgi:hypothetical protein